MRALAVDYRTVALAPADRAMLDYAVRLTKSPRRAASEGVDGLREVGFDDRAILDICHVTAYYNYVNRLAEGLGIELESTWAVEDLTLTRREFEELRNSPDRA